MAEEDVRQGEARQVPPPRPPETGLDPTRVQREPRLWAAVLRTLSESPSEHEWNVLLMADARVREGYADLTHMHTLEGWLQALARDGDGPHDESWPMRGDLGPAAGVPLWYPVARARQGDLEVEDEWVRQVYYPITCVLPEALRGFRPPRRRMVSPDSPEWTGVWPEVSEGHSPAAVLVVRARYLGWGEDRDRNVPAPPEGDAEAVSSEVERLSRECFMMCRQLEYSVAKARAAARKGPPQEAGGGWGPTGAGATTPRHAGKEPGGDDRARAHDGGQAGWAPKAKAQVPVQPFRAVPRQRPDPEMDRLMRRAQDPKARLTPAEIAKATGEALRRHAPKRRGGSQ